MVIPYIPRSQKISTRSQPPTSTMTGAWLENILKMSKNRTLVLMLLAAALKNAMIILLLKSMHMGLLMLENLKQIEYLRLTVLL